MSSVLVLVGVDPIKVNPSTPAMYQWTLLVDGVKVGTGLDVTIASQVPGKDGYFRRTNMFTASLEDGSMIQMNGGGYLTTADGSGTGNFQFPVISSSPGCALAPNPTYATATIVPEKPNTVTFFLQMACSSSSRTSGGIIRCY